MSTRSMLGWLVAGVVGTAWVAQAAAPGKDETPSVGSLRESLEGGMAELGKLATDAREREQDVARADCVRDKQQRAEEVMELATAEVLAATDAGASEQSRMLAQHKLAAADERLKGLLVQARDCRGVQSPDDEDNATRNRADEPPTIPLADPTQLPPQGTGVPPGVDDGRPPVVVSPSQ